MAPAHFWTSHLGRAWVSRHLAVLGMRVRPRGLAWLALCPPSGVVIRLPSATRNGAPMIHAGARQPIEETRLRSLIQSLSSVAPSACSVLLASRRLAFHSIGKHHLSLSEYRIWQWPPAIRLGARLELRSQGGIDECLDVLAGDVQGMTRSRGAPISLIGWSLGGICAREVAKRLPACASQVITIGMPFAGSPDHTRARWVYRLLNGKKPPCTKASAQRAHHLNFQPNGWHRVVAGLHAARQRSAF